MKALRSTVRTAKEFIRWAPRAERGDIVTYHIGNLAADRADVPDLNLLAETIRLFAQCGYVTTQQTQMRLATSTTTWHSVVRSGGGWAPRSILFDQCDAFAYRALEALRDRDAAVSAPRAIREYMGCPDSMALDFLALLFARGWVARAEPRGWALTPDGHRMLT